MLTTSSDAAAKLTEAARLAAKMLDAHASTTLASIARTASIVHSVQDPTLCAIGFKNVEDPAAPSFSWPSVGYLTPETVALPVEEIAGKIIGMFDDLIARGRLKI